MGLKKKNKVSAEFSMSSLTDIIFLLLIFFMLTSSVMVPNALNMKMPGPSSSAVTVDSKPGDVTIRGKDTFVINGKKYSKRLVEAELQRLQRKEGRKKLNMTLSPSRDATNESVVFIMDIMQRRNINCILAIED